MYRRKAKGKRLHSIAPPVDPLEELSSDAGSDMETSFPLTAKEHGKKIILVHVGQGSDAQTFSIHKNLICKASNYFDKALTSGFKEGAEGQLHLPSECPMTFEVLYQWLYSGRFLRAKFYTQGQIPEDTLWLRVYKMAECRLVDELQRVAYQRLREYFNSDVRVVPSIKFIEELYDKDIPHIILDRYIVAHTAFWIQKGEWREWEAVLRCEPSYGVEVAIELAKIHSTTYREWRRHPEFDPELDNYNILPEGEADNQNGTPSESSSTGADHLYGSRSLAESDAESDHVQPYNPTDEQAFVIEGEPVYPLAEVPVINAHDEPIDAPADEPEEQSMESPPAPVN